MSDSREILRSIASFSLPGSEDGESTAIAISDKDWTAVISGMRFERLTGLAVAAVEANHLHLTEAQLTDLLEGHRDAMGWALEVERTLLKVGSAFDSAGIEFVLLKGPSLAHTVYPNPSWRPFADLDLLVRTRDWSRACALLAEQGFRRDLPEPRRRFDERFGKAATHSGSRGPQIDLHRTLVLGPFGLWLDPDELFHRTVDFELAGRRLRRLDDTAQLLHQAMHASLGWRPPLLLSLRDVVQVAAMETVDWDAAEDLARRWRLAAVLRHAFGAAAETLGARWPDAAGSLLALEPRRREVRALKAYTTERRGRGGMAISTIGAIHGLRGKAAYAWGLLMPDRRFLSARMGGGERGSYRARWKVALRWLRRRQRSIQG